MKQDPLLIVFPLSQEVFRNKRTHYCKSRLTIESCFGRGMGHRGEVPKSRRRDGPGGAIPDPSRAFRHLEIPIGDLIRWNVLKIVVRTSLSRFQEGAVSRELVGGAEAIECPTEP